MNKLKELDLVGINKNPKGGRFPPNYTIFSLFRVPRKRQILSRPDWAGDNLYIAGGVGIKRNPVNVGMYRKRGNEAPFELTIWRKL